MANTNMQQAIDEMNRVLRQECEFYLATPDSDAPSPTFTKLAGPARYGETLTAPQAGYDRVLLAERNGKPLMWWKVGRMEASESVRAENTIVESNDDLA